VIATCDLLVAMTAAASLLLHGAGALSLETAGLLLLGVGALFHGIVGLPHGNPGHSPIVPATRRRRAITTEGCRGGGDGIHLSPERRGTRVLIVGTSQGRLMRIGGALTSAGEMLLPVDVAKAVSVEVQVQVKGSGDHQHRKRPGSVV